MVGAFEGLVDTMAAVVTDVPTYQAPQWADPRVWLIAGGVLVLLTLVSIYFKFFSGRK